MLQSITIFLHRWPRLTSTNYQKTSEATEEYNCAAFAAYDEENEWWPAGDYYWAFSKTDIPELENFLRYFQSKKYIVCKSESYEKGFEKVAIYTSSSCEVLHLARQDSLCPKLGWWQSKMGSLEDIAHEKLADLEGEFYGKVKYILKRRALR